MISIRIMPKVSTSITAVTGRFAPRRFAVWT